MTRFFVGIDVAMRRHQVAIIDDTGRVRLKSLSISNSTEGLAELTSRLSKLGPPEDIQIGMEATGTYGWALHYHLTSRGYRVIVLNPLQTGAFARVRIRRTKTDQIDAVEIAQLIRFGRVSPAIIPDERALRLRELSRYRSAVIRLLGRFTNLLNSRIYRIFPEFADRFSHLWAPSALGILEKHPHPKDLLAAQDIEEDLRRLSRGRWGKAKSVELLEAARNTIGLPLAADVYRLEIRGVVEVIRILQRHRDLIEARIVEVLEEVPQHLTSIPGIGPITAAAVLGEIVDIRLFSDPKKLVAFAGMDPSTFQTGEFLGSHSHVSKRGSTHLRHALWMAAFAATRFNPELRAFYQKKRQAGKHHKVALGAVCRKLLHLVWRILTDNRPYQERPMPITH